MIKLKKFFVAYAMIQIVVIPMLLLSAAEPLVPYRVLNQKHSEWADMQVYVVEVPLVPLVDRDFDRGFQVDPVPGVHDPLVSEREASDPELDAIADYLLGVLPPVNSWVFFYLPGDVPADWEFQTPHYLPQKDGDVVVPFSHYRTGYEHTGVWR